MISFTFYFNNLSMFFFFLQETRQTASERQATIDKLTTKMDSTNQSLKATKKSLLVKTGDLLRAECKISKIIDSMEHQMKVDLAATETEHQHRLSETEARNSKARDALQQEIDHLLAQQDEDADLTSIAEVAMILDIETDSRLTISTRIRAADFTSLSGRDRPMVVRVVPERVVKLLQLGFKQDPFALALGRLWPPLYEAVC